MNALINKYLPFKKQIKRSQRLKDLLRSIYLKRYLVFPYQVQIESTSLCNSRCLHCEHKDLKRPYASMEMSLYKKIINEIFQYKKYCKRITLSLIGEPLLDPTFFEKVRYAKYKKIPSVSIYCNASLLTADNCKKLINSRLDKVIFSVDGATKESFESVRVGLSYFQVVENIKRLATMKKKLYIKKPLIEVQMVITPFNRNEQELFDRTWKGIADKHFTRKMHVWGGKTLKKEIIDNSRSQTKEQQSLLVPCFYLWKSMIISQSGKVALCCIDAHIHEEIGDLKKQSIYEIWHGKRLGEIRKKHLTGKMNEISLCRQCNFRQTKSYPWWWYDKKIFFN